MAAVTAAKYTDHVRCASFAAGASAAIFCACSVLTACRAVLGWLHHQQSVPVGELSLTSVFPSADRSGVRTAFAYMQWCALQHICVLCGTVAANTSAQSHLLYSAAECTVHAGCRLSARSAL